MLDLTNIKSAEEERLKELSKSIWNAALEEAAKAAEKYESYGAAYEIRTLKK